MHGTACFSVLGAVMLNNASDYWTNGLHWTPNTNYSPFVR